MYMVTKRIIIVGGGGLAWSLIEGISKSSCFEIVGVWVRRSEAAQQITDHFGLFATNIFEELPLADVYILAVSDGAIREVSESLPFPEGALVAHVSGSSPLKLISSKIENRAVIYPMQTFTQGRHVDWHNVYIFVEGVSEECCVIAEQIAKELSPDKVSRLSSQQREVLHVAAVFGSNFTNALLGVAAEQLHSIGLHLSIFKQLLEETIDKAMDSDDPSSIQSGPAIRGDLITQKRHLTHIEDEELREIYKLLSSMIWKTSKKN